ncbi:MULTISPECIES: DUF3007 family protein [Spirulina sp. CCY15215]|uniref:DUF3007 family protein n=1 Tax=Spirulina sp. CCY15215 TaxID=2767591 RepID=UPI00194FD397|nr:DUF3007 family protein [Spirulina major]
MRRIDAIAISFGVFLAGGIAYLVLRGAGLDNFSAGIWSQVLLVGGLLGWISTYLFRAFTHNMTYHQQRREYEDRVLQKRLDEMTPEELANLQADLQAEK